MRIIIITPFFLFLGIALFLVSLSSVSLGLIDGKALMSIASAVKTALVAAFLGYTGYIIVGSLKQTGI